MGKSFGEILADFKSDEEAENLVPLIEDEALRNGLVAWKSVNIRYKTPEDCPHENDTSQWNWLWTQVEYDKETFGSVAGIKTQDINKLIVRLIGLRLIYPDGTINVLAKQYLQSIIMVRLEKIRGKRKSQKPESQNKPKKDSPDSV